jgi:hypothetical protein
VCLIVRDRRSSACACARIRRDTGHCGPRGQRAGPAHRSIGGLPVLCKYIAGSSEDAEHVSVNAFSGVGIAVELFELAGRHEIASPAEVSERRRERPVLRVATPDGIERGARSVAGGEGHAVVDVFGIGGEHRVFRQCAPDFVLEAKQCVDDATQVTFSDTGAAFGRQYVENPGRGGNQTRRHGNGVEKAEQALRCRERNVLRGGRPARRTRRRTVDPRLSSCGQGSVLQPRIPGQSPRPGDPVVDSLCADGPIGASHLGARLDRGHRKPVKSIRRAHTPGTIRQPVRVHHPMNARVTVSDFQSDPMFPRIERAVAAILVKGKVVAPVDVLVRVGMLAPADLEAWRCARCRTSSA